MSVSGQFLEDERWGHRSGAQGLDDPADIGPMCHDQIAIEPLPEQRGKAAVAAGGFEGVETSIGQARDTRLEGDAEQMHHREQDIRDTAAVDMECGEVGAAVMAKDAIEGMDRLAGRAGDHGLVQWCIAVCDGCVDFDDRVAPVMGIDGTACFARPAQVIGLTIGGSPPAFAEPRRHGLGMDGVGQTAERCAKRFLAHVPGLHPQQGAPRGDTADLGHARQTKVRRLGDKSSQERALVAWR